VTPDEELTARVAALLDEVRVPYMVAGSLASSRHGPPRSSQDVDIVIDPEAPALAQFVRRLDGEGFYVDAEHAADALARRRQFNALDPDTGLKIDLIIRKERPFSRSEFDRARTVRLRGGATVRLASAEDTILAKLEWALLAGGSERQIHDVEGIVAVQGAALDRAYIERWAGVLGVADLWHRVLEAQP
jgi:hypothetical protein